MNYQSPFEKKKKEELITVQKNSLHESLRNFKSPVCILETSKYRIRIDDMGNEKFRYASWKFPQSKSEKPELVILNGKVEFDGSGGNHSFIFESPPITQIFKSLRFAYSGEAVYYSALSHHKGLKNNKACYNAM